MKSLVLVSLILMAVAVLSLINAVRVQKIRDELDSGADALPVPPSMESLVVRDSEGKFMPKKAYWLEIAPETGPVEDTQDYELVLATSDDTDHVAFTADVDSGRVAYIYRPDKRELFQIERSGTSMLLESVVGNDSAFVAPTAEDDDADANTGRRMTVIGLPNELVTATAPTTT